jgi:hypothetical protein
MMNTTLTIYDDGKNEYRSFHANLENLPLNHGYGPTKEDAINNYVIILEEFMVVVGLLFSDLSSGSFESIAVDRRGFPIPE